MGSVESGRAEPSWGWEQRHCHYSCAGPNHYAFPRAPGAACALFPCCPQPCCHPPCHELSAMFPTLGCCMCSSTWTLTVTAVLKHLTPLPTPPVMLPPCRFHICFNTQSHRPATLPMPIPPSVLPAPAPSLPVLSICLLSYCCPGPCRCCMCLSTWT